VRANPRDTCCPRVWAPKVESQIIKIPMSGPDTIDKATCLVNQVLRTASLSVGLMTVHPEQEMAPCVGTSRAVAVSSDTAGASGGGDD